MLPIDKHRIIPFRHAQKDYDAIPPLSHSEAILTGMIDLCGHIIDISGTIILVILHKGCINAAVVPF